MPKESAGHESPGSAGGYYLIKRRIQREKYFFALLQTRELARRNPEEILRNQ
jgi:hypothetical protein